MSEVLLYRALLDAPELEDWRGMTREELEEFLRMYVSWFRNERARAIRKATEDL